MYKIYCDGKILYHPANKELAISEPVVNLELNNAGSFSFKMPPNHPCYDEIRKFKSSIEVFQDEVVIFAGRPSEIDIDYYKQKKIYCEGELAYLNDSIQRPSENHDITVRGFLELLIANHNNQVDSSKVFKVGAVTVTDPNDSLYLYTNYETTLEDIKKKLVERLGGYLIVRHQDDCRILDYLEELPNTCSQTIRFGVNLLDYASNIDISEIATRVIPLGTTLEESRYTAIDERLTIESVNEGNDYVQSDEAVEMYGIITKIKTWDDVTLPSNLKRKGQEYLESVQWEKMKLEVTAVDLHTLDSSIDSINLGDRILAVSKPHGLKRYFPVSKLSIDILNPANNKISLGLDVDVSITTKSNTVESVAQEAGKIPINAILNSAKENANEIIKMATNGYIVLNMDENGKPKEFLVMDTDDIKTATKVWRWNVNGLGYSNTGYDGTYGLAMTMDGGIIADFINAGTMYADRIKGGTLILGGGNNVNGVMTVKDSAGTVIVTLNEEGIAVTKGSITGSKIQNATEGRRAVLDESSALKGYHDDTLYNIVDVASQGDEVQLTLDAQKQMTIRTPRLSVVNQSYGEGSGTAYVTSTGSFSYVSNVDKDKEGCKEMWVNNVYCTLPVFLSVTWSTVPYVLGMKCTGGTSQTNRV